MNSLILISMVTGVALLVAFSFLLYNRNNKDKPLSDQFLSEQLSRLTPAWHNPSIIIASDGQCAIALSSEHRGKIALIKTMGDQIAIRVYDQQTLTFSSKPSNPRSRPQLIIKTHDFSFDFPPFNFLNEEDQTRFQKLLLKDT